MEMESSRNDTGDSILRHTINFVYEEIMNQFLKYNGKTKKSTFWLINWGILIDEKSSEMYGNLETKIVYKCYIIYLLNLFSKYMETQESDYLAHIQKILCCESLINCSPVSVIPQFQLICLKAMAHSMIRNPIDKNFYIFKSYVENQSFINQNLSFYYSTPQLYYDICNVLRQDEYLKEKSLFKQIFENSDDDLVKNETIDSSAKIKLNNHNVAEPVIVQNKPKAPDTRTESTSQVTSLHENLLRKVIKKPIKWNEKEIVDLIYLTGKMGHAWAKIAKNYNHLFQNRNARDLKKKYYTLKTNDQCVLEFYKNKASLLNEEEFKIEQIIERKKYLKWEDEECAYLVHGVKVFGKNWVFILSNYNRNFKEGRSSQDLCDKYRKLEKNLDLFESYKGLAQELFPVHF